MRTGTTLLLQTTEGMEPLGAFNQPVYKSFSQIRSALARLGPTCSNYFARPDFDSDGMRIGWVAGVSGEPRRWVDMSAEEQASLEPARQEVHARLAAYQAELSSAPEHSPQRNFSLVLAQAMRVPGPEYLYFVDGAPMIAFWGFRHAGLPDGVDPLLLPLHSVALPSNRTTAPPPFATPGAVAPVASWWRWRWLLWLLAALLLLLLLLWLLLPRRVVPILAPLQSDHEAVPRDGVLPSPGIPLPPGGVTPGVAAPGTVAPGTVAPGTASPGAVVPGSGSGTDVVPAAPDAGADPTKAAPPADDGTVPPGETPVNPSGNTPSGTPDAPPTLPQLPAPGAAEPPGKPLALPQNAPPGAAAYMEGVWRSRSGLRDPQGNPLDQFYRFDKNGQGEVVVRGGGRECKGSAQAVTGPDGQLTIREAPALACSDGRPLSGATTQCGRRPDGTVGCEGTNNSDRSKFGVQMQQVGR